MLHIICCLLWGAGVGLIGGLNGWHPIKVAVVCISGTLALTYFI